MVPWSFKLKFYSQNGSHNDNMEVRLIGPNGQVGASYGADAAGIEFNHILRTGDNHLKLEFVSPFIIGIGKWTYHCIAETVSNAPGDFSRREQDFGWYGPGVEDVEKTVEWNWLIPHGREVLDAAFYLSLYPDLRNAFGDNNVGAAAEHWMRHGQHEARASSPAFDVSHYHGIHPDLQAAFGATNFPASVEHWLTYGIREGRESSPVFNVRFYLESHPDLVAAFGSDFARALDHWLRHGITEGRQASPTFHARYYLETNPDVANAYGPQNFLGAIQHWLVYGKSEGRRGVP
jgi:hypothetical protein